MTEDEIRERKQYLALQAFYLDVKKLVKGIEKKHPEFNYNGSFRKEKGVSDFEKNNKKRNDIFL
jgi:hypothetical protein